MRKRKGSLPEELIEEILLRLPVRSLLRFKCVCKYWHSLISDVRFAKSHFDLAAAPTHRLLLRLIARYEAEAVDEDDSAGVFFNIPDPSLAPPCPACDVLVAGSCRGFLLLTTEFAVSDFIYFVIWNPCTGFLKRFNKQFNRYDELFNPRVLYGIGYDPSTDDYLVVTVTLRMEVHCFSSRTNSWSCCTNGQGIVPYIHMGHSFARGAFLNGALHWLVRSPHDLTRLIIAFDVIERRLSEIPLSHDLAVAMKGKHCYLRVMEGCLSLSLSGYQVWTMKEYKVQSSWTKTLVVSHNYCFYPICISKNGETFGCNSAAQTLARFNDKCELLELRTHARCKFGYDIPHCVMYRESLLSLPGDFEKPSEDQSLEELI